MYAYRSPGHTVVKHKSFVIIPENRPISVQNSNSKSFYGDETKIYYIYASHYDYNSYDRVISVYHHLRCVFESRSWQGILDM